MDPELAAPQWTVRAFRPGDERALVALFARVFGRSMSEAHWRWKLTQQPSPVANVVLAVVGETPIFQYAAIPTRYRVPEGEVTAMVSVDTMTAPEHRRRGLLTAVASRAYARWREAGVPFVIGLPNERWGSRTAALGWQRLVTLQWLVRPLRPEAILARRLRRPLLARMSWLGRCWNGWWNLCVRPDGAVDTRFLSRAGPEMDQLWQRLCGQWPVSIVRDAAWVNWRYLESAAFTYRVRLAERSGQPVGYCAFRIDDDGRGKFGMIAEMITANDDATARRTLIAQVLHDLQAEGADSARTLAIPGSPLHRALRYAGFLPGPGAFVVCAVPLQERAAQLIRQPWAWSVAAGDFDVV